jgi:hypothetical protein
VELESTPERDNGNHQHQYPSNTTHRFSPIFSQCYSAKVADRTAVAASKSLGRDLMRMAV